MEESAYSKMLRLGPIVKEYDELLFEKILREVIDEGVVEIDITGWTFEAIRTLLRVIRYMDSPPILISSGAIRIFVHPPTDSLIDPLALQMVNEPW